MSDDNENAVASVEEEKPPLSLCKDDISPLIQNEEIQSENAEGDKKDSVPPLSQSEIEHLTYLSILGEYNMAKDRRRRYKRYGAWFIIISGIVFLTLIFSVEAKILFLCFWIITILACVAVMIRTDYVYDKFREYLNLPDELDSYDDEEEEEQ